MKMKEVYEIVTKTYTGPGTTGWVKRNRKSPRFVVGYTSMTTYKAHVAGTSDVDWESAFHNAGVEGF